MRYLALALCAIVAMTACAPATQARPASTPLSSQEPVELQEILPPEHLWVRLRSLDIFLDEGMAAADVKDITDLADADTDAIERVFGHDFPKRPRVALYGDSARFAAAMPPNASEAIKNALAIAQPQVGRVVINVEKLRKTTPMTALRHELSHLMLHQVLGGRPVPAWFNEGFARLQEESIPGFEGQAEIGRYIVASRAATATLPVITQLASARDWDAAVAEASRSPAAGQLSPYAVAAEVVRLLRDDLKMEGLAKIFDLVRKGSSFESGYRAHAGGPSFSDFVAAYPERLRQIAGPIPGAAIVPAGSEARLIVYGVTPDADATLSIDIAGQRPLVANGKVGPAGVFVVRLEQMPRTNVALRMSGSGISFAATVPPRR